MLQLPSHHRQVHAICAHLGLAETQRSQQLDLLCHLVRDEVPADAPLVVAGDFNDWRGRAHRVLAEGAGLKEVFVQAYGQAARTFPSRMPVLRIDHVFVSDQIVVKHVFAPYTSLTRIASDHLPLVVDFQLAGAD